jgi:predicted transposase YbfD/YdcC
MEADSSITEGRLMSASPLALTQHFASLRDPRRRHGTKYLLADVLFVAICAVIAGANDWQAIATFAEKRLAWLQRLLPHLAGAPCHDTFERVFARLNPAAFARCFGCWMQAVGRVLGLKHIALDGKCVCGNGPASLGPLYLVSAWATQHSLSLAQVPVDSKSNEITALPKLLELLELNGALVTIDAIGCQKKIAAQVVAGGGDYLLAVKDNQETLADDIREAFGRGLDSDYAGLAWDQHTTQDSKHGRCETRTYTVIYQPEGLRTGADWPGLAMIGMCFSERSVAGGEASLEMRYYISSRALSAAEFGAAVRSHWRIENNLHWQLDVTFREDESRIENKTSEANFAVLRRLALTLLKAYPSKKSMANKRFAAAMDTDMLEAILQIR